MGRPSASEDAYRAIADPTRRRVIELLAEQPLSAGEIAACFSVCQSTVSEHLAVLRRAGIVTFSEDAGRRIYELTPDPLREIAVWASPWMPPRPSRRTRA